MENAQNGCNHIAIHLQAINWVKLQAKHKSKEIEVN